MDSREIELLASNSLPIVGIRLIDDSVSDFEYIRKDNVLIYQLPKGNFDKVYTKDGEMQLVDSSGNNWDVSDVEYNNA